MPPSSVLAKPLLLCCLAAASWSMDPSLGADVQPSATSGIIPFGVSVVRFPYPVTDLGFLGGIVSGVLYGKCFLETIKVDLDRCKPLRAAGIDAELPCIRMTLNWPYGFVEGSDRYGHTFFKSKTFIEHLKQVLPGSPKPKPPDPNRTLADRAYDAMERAGGRLLNILTKDLNPVKTSEATKFGPSGERFSAGLGRAGPLPLTFMALLVIVEVLTLGQICPADFQLASITGRWWVLLDADRGFTSSYRGIPSSVLYSQDTAGYYWSSLMTTLWLGGLDVLGFLSNGQSSDLTPRASIGMGAQVVALTRAAAVAWDTTNAPALLWGYLHFTRMGGFINRIHLDTSAYTPEGIVANTPVLIPFATYVQNLWPGNLRGCPRKSCDYFTKTGEMGTNAQYMQIPIQEQRNWNKANRILIDKNMAVLFWPKITCCRMCMLDLPESLYRHFNGKPNDEFFWALALPWTSNGEKEKVQREQKEQEERNEKFKEDAEKEMQEKEKEFAEKEERFQELEEKQKNGEELTQEEREEYDRLNRELGGEVSDEQVTEGENEGDNEMSDEEFAKKKAAMQKAQRAEFKRALKCFKK